MGINNNCHETVDRAIAIPSKRLVSNQLDDSALS